MKHYVVKNKKTIKLIVKYRMAKGHKPLPTKVWERIYSELGMPESGTPWVCMADCDRGEVYIVEGLFRPSDVKQMAVEDIAKFPG